MSIRSARSATCILLWLFLSQLSTGRYVRPEDCTWEPIPDAAGVSMACRVRTLQAGLNPTNFSLIMPGHTAQLTIVCDDLMVPSDLANSSFEHLTGLRTLTIEKCKLNQIPSNAFQGLSDLEHLAVRTSSNERNRFSLRLSASALAPLKRVETADFSRSNIDLLPQGLFCSLDQLRFVNLSNNAFQDTHSLGFSSTSRCRPALRELTVSHNRLRVLSNGGFASLGSLEQLFVDHNQISRIESDFLNGLSRLNLVDLSHNAIFSLPSSMFRSSPALSEVYIRNNSISALPAGLFAGLRELTVLDLSHNQLTGLAWLAGPERSAELGKLAVLDLAHNRLTRIDGHVFVALRSLQSLQLQNNLIDFIADNAFEQLRELQSLTVSHNRLKRIGPHVLVGLDAVMTLNLYHNQIDSVHAEAFSNMSMLQELNLAENELTAVPVFSPSLTMLRSLDLSQNRIDGIINASSYAGLAQLYAFNLMGNRIGNLSKGVFNHLSSVRILNLADNGIQTIDQGTFDDVPSLHYLRLDSNDIEDVNGLFSNLHDLTMLNVSVNQLRSFDYALIPVGLQWLDIHSNQIEALGNYFRLEDSHKLRTLDASYNRLAHLEPSSLPNGIEIVFLKHNNIKLIQPFTFEGKHNLSRVDLTNNQLSVIEMAALRLSEVATQRPLPEFAIAGNPYQCNCHMEWLQQLHKPSEHATLYPRQYPRLVDLLKVECELTFSKAAKVMPLVKVDPSQFLCPYKSHCFSQCHCCDFDACDCEMVCPDDCSCYHHRTWGSNVVDCSARNHSHNPSRLPMDVTELYLDGNEMPHLNALSFFGRKNLQVLFLNASNVLTIANQTFAGLSDLRVLRLEDNRLSTLNGFEFDGLDQLSQLHLSNNRLEFISNVTFTKLKSLEVLYLDRNLLVELSIWSFQLNPRLHELRLAENPWTCDCRYTVDFTQFLFNEHGNTVRDMFQLSCVYNETRKLPLWELNVTDCFDLAEATSLARPFYIRQMEDVLLLALILVLLILVLCAGVAITIIYRRQLSVWFFSRYGFRMCYRAPVEEEKLFDAFVSYSKRDEAFVAQILAPELECGNPPYRLCLHYRDLSMAGGYLSEAIEEAVESSRRTIVVLSEHFLKSEWCRYEFKSAHSEVLNNSSHRLVVIFLGRVSYRELDADIRLWLKDSTFLHWGEKNFWDKLRYSLPDARHRKVLRSDLNSVAVHI